MFSRKQLDLISSLCAGEEVSLNERHALKKFVDAAIWQQDHQLSPKEKKLVEAAIAQGRVQRVPAGVSGLPQEGADPRLLKPAWRDGKTPDKAEKPSRLKPQAVTEAKDGEELLAALGL